MSVVGINLTDLYDLAEEYCESLVNDQQRLEYELVLSLFIQFVRQRQRQLRGVNRSDEHKECTENLRLVKAVD